MQLPLCLLWKYHFNNHTLSFRFLLLLSQLEKIRSVHHLHSSEYSRVPRQQNYSCGYPNFIMGGTIMSALTIVTLIIIATILETGATALPTVEAPAAIADGVLLHVLSIGEYV